MSSMFVARRCISSGIVGRSGLICHRGLYSGISSSSSSSFSASASEPSASPRDDGDESNVPDRVRALIGRNLHRRPNHPIETVKSLVHDYFCLRESGIVDYELFDDFDAIVSVKQCFDDLLVPLDHVSRSYSDTFYVDKQHLLRPHTSAHQTQLLRQGSKAFLVAADCYRRDEIDAQHYPCFHQIEGVRVFDPEEIPATSKLTSEEFVVDHLKQSLEGLVHHVFGSNEIREIRWVHAYFPFTNPSLEMEILYRGEWMEVLGCGAIHHDILQNCSIGDKVGWAFGIGLERLAMSLYDIPDIRLFWSKDERFLNQFKSGIIAPFTPYSKFPVCYKDVSFWVSESFVENDLHALVGDIAGDLVESVELHDEFRHPISDRVSKCFRLNYRSMDRSLTNKEVDTLQDQLREAIQTRLRLELR